ncbi:MAG: repressor LexA [Alkalinema sp. CACIAM 70d]|nr:MAG: repressor LexA [Alkalinema sp. CACIAM 70d]
MQYPSPHLKLLEYLEAYIQLHGYIPVIDEMMAAMEKSRSAIQNSLKHLEREGYIERRSGKARAIRILKSNRGGIPILKSNRGGIPIWGTIAAGYLSEVFTDSQDVLPISSPKLKPGDFALQVAGDSMIGDHITDGSFVIMRPVPDLAALKDGAIVAAWVEGRGTTLKHFYREGNHISLIASNPNYPPITVDVEECRVEVQGVLLWVWQDWSSL